MFYHRGSGGGIENNILVPLTSWASVKTPALSGDQEASTLASVKT